MYWLGGGASPWARTAPGLCAHRRSLRGASRAKAAACRSHEVPWWFFWSRARQGECGRCRATRDRWRTMRRWRRVLRAESASERGRKLIACATSASCTVSRMPSSRGVVVPGVSCAKGRAGGHAGCRGDEPRAEVSGGVLGVAFFFGEDECSYESGDLDAEVEERVAVSGEG